MKKHISAFLIALLMVFSLFTEMMPRAAASAAISSTDIVDAAKSLCGKYPKYVWGGKSPSAGGFDCSGFVYHVLHTMLGYDITSYQVASNSEILNFGTIIWNKEDFLPGDIMESPTHMGIYIGNDRMVHSGNTYGVSQTSINGSWFNYQYAVRLNGVDYGSGTTSSKLPTSISISGLTTPGTIQKGNGAHISGTISSTGSRLSSVEAEILTANGGSTGIKASKNNVNSYSLSIYGSDIDWGLTFGKLGAGTYFICYKATTADGKSETKDTSTFQVLGETKTYTVTFDPNGGSVYPRSTTVKEGGYIDIFPTPTREGYKFQYWTLYPDGMVNVVIGDHNKTVFPVTENMTIYAQWQKERSEELPTPEPQPIPEPTPTSTPAAELSCAHTYERKVESAHPHKIYMECTKCGERYYTGGTESVAICENCWGDWSGWSTTPVTASSTRQVETQQVKVSDAYKEYRYGRYVDPTGRHDCWCATYFQKIGYTPILQYSDWSTSRYSVADSGWTCGYCGGNHIGAASNDGSRSYWNEYRLSNGSYYWEESRDVPATYQTQYRYRDLISG